MVSRLAIPKSFRQSTKNATYPHEQLAPKNGSNTVTIHDLRAALASQEKNIPIREKCQGWGNRGPLAARAE
jgi:hypothetical protein